MIGQIKKANENYSITELSALFTVKLSTYYYQQQEKPTRPEKIKLINAIKSVATETGDSYGKRRMNEALQLQGFQLGIYKTASLMKKANVVAINPKKKHYYPDSGETHHKAPNHLKRAFSPGTVNTHWVGDITYIRTHQGWSYLASVLDLGSREIVGWAMSQQPNAELAKEALRQAILKHQPDTTPLLFHSDQGVQYSANKFVDYLNTFGITQSMSRRGNCWDNAVMERFFRSLKTERLNNLVFVNHLSAVDAVEKYIRFYNYKRLHSTLGYLTPNQKKMELKNAA